jgi:hypothetical protein
MPRDASHWAAKVERLEVQAREGVRGTNVAGKRVTGPIQGFGKLWQKTYSVEVGPDVAPEQAIAVWKAHFPEFWPKGNRFAGALTGISPGDVALLDIAVGGGVKMSTGVFVLYADAESFTFATPRDTSSRAGSRSRPSVPTKRPWSRRRCCSGPATRSTSWACRSCTAWRTGSGSRRWPPWPGASASPTRPCRPAR